MNKEVLKELLHITKCRILDYEYTIDSCCDWCCFDEEDGIKKPCIDLGDHGDYCLDCYYNNSNKFWLMSSSHRNKDYYPNTYNKKR